MIIDKTIGVLALQGAFKEHVDVFKQIIENNKKKYKDYNFSIIEVRTSEELKRTDALLIPGGESTSISIIAERNNLFSELEKYVKDESKSIFGTCAGMIFLSKKVTGGKKLQKILGAIDIEVHRNAFGRQYDSFETTMDFSSFIKDCKNYKAVFIRAPVMKQIVSKDIVLSDIGNDDVIISSNNYQNPFAVEILHKIKNKDTNEELIVAARQGKKLVVSFHPELAQEDNRFHEWFLNEFVLQV